MKFTTTILSLLPAALTLATPGSGFERRQAPSSASLSYDPVYDNAAGSIDTVACSAVLRDEGFNVFGDIPSFARIGGAPTISGGSSPSCGTCYQISYTPSTGQTSSIYLTAIDLSSNGFNVAQAAMDELTGNRSVDLGRIDVTYTQVDRSLCGLGTSS
ncbi:Cerato-platanin-domain-containing protein [Aspergillus varians]